MKHPETDSASHHQEPLVQNQINTLLKPEVEHSHTCAHIKP